MDRQLKRDSSRTSASNAHDPHGTLAPGKRTLVEHALVAPRVSEGKHLNAVLKVVAYDAQGGVIGSWGAKARWEGPLPEHFHGDHGSGTWIWDDTASVHTVRIRAHADGSGGESVEAWAAKLHAMRVEIFAAPIDAVAERPEARSEEARNAPGHADDRQVENRTGRTPGHAPTGNGSHASAPHPSAPGHETAPSEAGSGEDGLARAIALERELGIGLGQDDDGDGADGSGDRSNGPATTAPEGGIPDTRLRGKDASETGQGPGPKDAKDAKADGDHEGSTATGGNQEAKAGDQDGEDRGAANGRFGGEGREGDDGVRGAMALFGGLVGVPEALKGVVELALLIEAGDITGAGGNLFRDLFKAGFGRATSVALVREVVAREARIVAEREVRVVMKQLATKKAFTSLAREEQERVLRIVYWEKQRQFFRGYLQAAKAEQRAVQQALKNAKGTQRIPLASRRATAVMGEEIAKVEPVAGRLPRNHAYAGRSFPPERLPPQYRTQGLRFKETGYPDFEPYAKVLPNGQKNVRVVFTGSRKADEAAANAAVKLERTPRGYTWHHNEDMETMCLVPDDLHKTVAHTGGTAGYKHRHGVDYGD
jgi:hypothetical protein